MDLPKPVVNRILLYLIDVDTLYSLHMARGALKMAIDHVPSGVAPRVARTVPGPGRTTHIA